MTVEQLNKFLDEMPQRGIPECELAVSLNGELVYYRTVGRENLDRNICFVCSVSKITTCVAALRLIEEGKLGLDDPVSKYIPEYAFLTVKEKDGSIRPAKTVMTIRHLFLMTGGLNYSLMTGSLVQVRQIPGAGTVEIAKALTESPLDFDPGEKFQYSLCHDVLAAVVEIVSGMRFRDYAKKYIFDPLGMSDTGYHLPDELKDRVCRQYKYVNGINKANEIEPHNDYIFTSEHDSGGAGLYTTAIDQLKLLTALSLGGTAKDGYKLLSEESVKSCETGLLTDAQLPYFWPQRLYGYNWGLCGRVHTKPVISGSLSPVGEFGWDGATGPYAFVDRQNGLAFYYGMHIYGCTYAYNQLHGTIRNDIYKVFLDK